MTKKPAKRVYEKQAGMNKAYREKKRDVKGATVPPVAKDDKFGKPPKGDPMAWLKCYLHKAFRSDFGQIHYDIKDGFMYALETGNNVEILAPRGTGKSTEVNGLTLYALLEGMTKFPVVIPWDSKARNRALRFWKTQLCFNSRLHRDYPEATAVFKESRGIGNRLTALTQGNEATGAMLAISEGIIVLPHGLGAIGSATINGNPRGMNYASIDGSVIRPSLAIVDDPQDRQTAKSQTLVQETIEIINADILDMGAFDELMPIIMTATIVENDDVADFYSKDPNWRVVRTGQITQWPIGFDEKTSEVRCLWEEFNAIRLDDGQKNAVEFYKQNKDKLIKGMEVSWDQRFDAKKGEPDAFYSAMSAYYKMGEQSFMAERQNAPMKRGVDIYTLTPDAVIKRTTDRNSFELPEWAELTVCATDINPSYALTTVVTAFGKDRTSAVLWYGKYEDAPLPTNDEMSDTQKQQIIFGALMRHGEQLLSYPQHGRIWAIDGGGAQSTVAKRFSYEWNRKHPNMPVMVCYGRAGKSAKISARNETIRRRGADGSWLLCRDKDPTYGVTEWVLWNADYWRECMQRAWTCESGAVGSATLPKGHHREYAEHICREKLKGKVEMNGRMIYDFEKSVGRNDFADATNMCHMIADLNGIGTERVQTKQRQQRSIRHVAI
jgi:hypothetical protein